MTTAAPPGAGAPPAAPPGPPGVRPRRRAPGWLRGTLWTLAVLTLIVTGGILTVLLEPPPGPGLPLDPGSTRPGGSEALADLMAQRGIRIVRAPTVTRAVTAARAGVPATLVVTSPQLLHGAELARLARLHTDLVLVGPGGQALSVLAPGVSLVGFAPVSTAGPACRLPAARLAGRAELGGTLVSTTRPGANRCYPAPGPRGGWGLVRYRAGHRLITVLGTGAPLTNRELARRGNAALALNLLSAHRRIVWLVPSPAAAAAVPPTGPGQPRSIFGLLPLVVYLVTAQLGVTALVAALWRMRRFGPLVTEPLPVVVRAAETTEGHARLYQRRRARDRAASALRSAALDRLLPRLGLPQQATAAAVCEELARRTGRGTAQVDDLLYGPVPRDDGALVRLAAALDTLEGEVLIQ